MSRFSGPHNCLQKIHIYIYIFSFEFPLELSKKATNLTKAGAAPACLAVFSSFSGVLSTFLLFLGVLSTFVRFFGCMSSVSDTSEAAAGGAAVAGQPGPPLRGAGPGHAPGAAGRPGPRTASLRVVTKSPGSRWLWLKRPVPKWLALVSGNMGTKTLRFAPPGSF